MTGWTRLCLPSPSATSAATVHGGSLTCLQTGMSASHSGHRTHKNQSFVCLVYRRECGETSLTSVVTRAKGSDTNGTGHGGAATDGRRQTADERSARGECLPRFSITAPAPPCTGGYAQVSVALLNHRFSTAGYAQVSVALLNHRSNTSRTGGYAQVSARTSQSPLQHRQALAVTRKCRPALLNHRSNTDMHWRLRASVCPHTSQ
jgi:hypothetical protein